MITMNTTGTQFEMRELEWRNEEIRKRERERMNAERAAMRVEMEQMRSEINRSVVQSQFEIDNARNTSSRESIERAMSLEISNACNERDEIRARLKSVTQEHREYESAMLNEFESVQTDLRLGQSDIGRHLENFVANATQQLLEANATQKEELSVMRSRLERIQSGIERNTSVLWSKVHRPRRQLSVPVEFVDDDEEEESEVETHDESDADSDTSEGKRCIDNIAKLLQRVDPTGSNYDEDEDGIEVDVSVLSRIQNEVSDGDSDYEEGLVRFDSGGYDDDTEPGEVPAQLYKFLSSTGVYQ